MTDTINLLGDVPYSDPRPKSKIGGLRTAAHVVRERRERARLRRLIESKS
jgi:hypothetical protein